MDVFDRGKVPGLWSMLASSSRCGLRLVRLAGSPVLCRTMVSSWTLLAKDSGDCNWRRGQTRRVRPHSAFSPMIPFSGDLVWYLVNDGLHMGFMDQVSIQQRGPLLRWDPQTCLHGDVDDLSVVFPPESLVGAELFLQLHQGGVFITFGHLRERERLVKKF